ncbi:EAL and HDOD domain-containing protein [Neptunicella marina]|uniref:EAL domain-containing protein n=1 Tax=Neptunicella marina TaxID=2125989 RepID=A0A8J6IUE0_9ALTE|nr:EAL domain-containing protein [Neptunicella marina]MBC3766020.1 EAL domain-containing protein [Neptunicella marina]
MYTYIARQAIFDRNKHVHAYELLFRDGESNCYPAHITPDEATSRLLTNSHLSQGLEDITQGKPAFINFFQDTLLHRFPTFLAPEKIVVELLEDLDVNEQLLDACKQIKQNGYRLALDDYDFDLKWQVILPYVDIIKINVSMFSQQEITERTPALKNMPIKLVAEKVETYEQFQFCLELGYDYFQGYFFTYPEVIRNKSLPSSKLNLLELINVSSAKELDFNYLNSIFERDVTLTYRLLRFINDPLLNKSNQITSLKHALTFMGELEIKKFIALLALANLSDNKPGELLKLCLIRAKFCELVSAAKREYNNPPMGFLAGLLSMLDSLLDQPMSVLVNKLPISDELKMALSGEPGNLFNYLQLVRALERAQWQLVTDYAKLLQLDELLVFQLHHQALLWGNHIHLASQSK